ncbi:unnamed protein product [Gadus morhua 'NCC']
MSKGGRGIGGWCCATSARGMLGGAWPHSLLLLPEAHSTGSMAPSKDTRETPGARCKSPSPQGVKGQPPESHKENK